MRRAIVVLTALAALAIAAPASAAPPRPFTSEIVNFDSRGGQIVKTDVDGNGVDAHDGDIARFGGRYWLYGTSYGCGYGLLTAGTPFCGFASYSSPDLVHWRYEGPLFDASTPLWQERCAPPRYGCYRPHVVRDERTGRYVLWINGYDNESNYHVFTSDSPGGPFAEAPEPGIAVNRGAGVGLNNGDQDVFVDRDGTGYLVLTDIRAGHRLKIERLGPGYESGTGDVVDLGVSGVEAPAMFRRGDRYYVAYSDPTCAYCPSTGTSYLTATSPMGPWRGAREKPDSWTVTPEQALHVDGGGVGLSRDGSSWGDYTLAFRARPLQTAGGGTYAQAGWAFRAADPGNGYVWLLGNYPHPGATGGNLTRVRIVDGGYASIEVVPLPFAIEGGRWYDVETSVRGDVIETRIDGRLVDTTRDATFATGRIGFREDGGNGESAEFDDVRVTAPDGSVLFSDDFSGDLAKWDRPPPQWQGFRINDTSCGGQPSFVAELPGPDGSVHLFASDLWNGRPNQALAGYFWTPLSFRADGSIEPYACAPRVGVTLAAGQPGEDADEPLLDAHSTDGVFRPYADGSPSFRRAQTFTVQRDGRLKAVRVETFQTGSPDAPLVLELARVDASGAPGAVLARRTIDRSAVSWSPREAELRTDLPVSAGERLAIVQSTDATRGAYGWAYDDADPYAGGGELYAPGPGQAWRAEPGRDLRFETLVAPGGGGQ